MVKTAVLMATYNGSQFIEKQLDSIRQQTLAPNYVLMRDDGSTDDTIAVVEAYIRKHHLTGWTIQQNVTNLGWRLNFRQLLLDAVPYDIDYIFFSDQDDVWYFDKNERQVEIMDRRSDIDLLSGDIDIEAIGENITVPNNFQFRDNSECISQYPFDMSYHNYRQGWTFCIRKRFANQVILAYRDNLVLSHDNLMTGISGVLGTGYNLNRSVGIHKRHGDNASGNLLNIKSSRNHHLQDLTYVASYYQILVTILQENDNAHQALALKYQEFSQKRLYHAQNRLFWPTIKQISTQKNYYDSFSNRMRDIIFLFKK